MGKPLWPEPLQRRQANHYEGHAILDHAEGILLGTYTVLTVQDHSCLRHCRRLGFLSGITINIHWPKELGTGTLELVDFSQSVLFEGLT